MNLSLKYQNETFLQNQEWSGILIAKHGAIHIECALNLSLKYQNETFLINQEWSGILIAKHGAIHITFVASEDFWSCLTIGRAELFSICILNEPFP